MNALLTPVAGTQWTSREERAQAGFNHRYQVLLKLLEREQVEYWIESGPASEGRLLSLVLHRAEREYEHLVPLNERGEALAYGKPLDEGTLVKRVRDELGRWGRWEAARAWRRRMTVWEVGQSLGKFGAATLCLAALALAAGSPSSFGLSGGQVLGALAGLVGLWGGCARVLAASKRRQFPNGMEDFVLPYPLFDVE